MREATPLLLLLLLTTTAAAWQSPLLLTSTAIAWQSPRELQPRTYRPRISPLSCQHVRVSLPSTEHTLLLAASWWGRDRSLTRHRSVGILPGRWWNLPDSIKRGDPVPAMLLAAVLALVVPALLRAVRGIRRWSIGRPSLASIVRRRGASAARFESYEPNAALEDANTLRSARRLCEQWASSPPTPPEASRGELEMAIGACVLDMVTSTADDARASAAGITLLRSLVDAADGVSVPASARRSGRGAPSKSPSAGATALRMATTVASRRMLGAGRDGDEGAAGTRDGYAGTLLMLSSALLAGAEARTEAAAVRQLFFGSGGEAERGERLRFSACRRLVRMEARAALSRLAAAAPPGSATPGSATPGSATLGSAMAPAPMAPAEIEALLSGLRWLPRLLGYPADAFVPTLLSEAMPTLSLTLERALAAWVKAGGSAGAGADGPDAWGLDGPDGWGLRERSAAFGMAGSAARLGGACLGYADTSGAAGGGEASPRELAAVGSAGIASTSRHAFYVSFITAAAADDVEEACAAGGAAGAQRTPRDFSTRDAPLLRRLLSVLPATASRGGRAAFEAAVRTAHDAGRLQALSGQGAVAGGGGVEPSSSLGRIADWLGLSPREAAACVAAFASRGAAPSGEVNGAGESVRAEPSSDARERQADSDTGLDVAGDPSPSPMGGGDEVVDDPLETLDWLWKDERD